MIGQHKCRRLSRNTHMHDQLDANKLHAWYGIIKEELEKVYEEEKSTVTFRAKARKRKTTARFCTSPTKRVIVLLSKANR